MSKTLIVSVVGAVVGIAGLFMNWYGLTDGTFFKAWGTSTAYILLGLYVLAVLFHFAAAKKTSRGMFVVAFILGLLSLGVVYMNYPDSTLRDLGATVENGMYMSIAGAVVVTIGTLVGMIKKA